MPQKKPSTDMTRQIESCSICRYYERFPDLDDDDDEDEEEDDIPTGVCRRYPPTQYPGLAAYYPEVIGITGWCGEFTPRS